MPLIPIRELAKHGVNTDIDPFDLPPQAFNFAKNVRFTDGSISRGPVWRNAATLGDDDPRYIISFTPSSGLDIVYLGYKSGRVYEIDKGEETDLSITDYADADSDLPFTSTMVANVIYINRPDRVPWAMKPSDTEFTSTIGSTNNWPSTYRANLIRSCGGVVVALNITKNGTSYPTMVKWSEFATANAVPTNWDHTVSGTNAAENVLADMAEGIIDASPLGEALIIYSRQEAWKMQATGNSDVFAFTKLFTDGGAINANCSVEVDGVHFVFGSNDLWTHDGTTKVSIATGRVRSFIYSTINASKVNRCFVSHNTSLKEVVFHYVSGDAYTSFNDPTSNGCNRAAVYNYVSKTWTFYDTPLVFSACMANLDSRYDWDSDDLPTWTTIGGAWYDQEDGYKRVLTYVGETFAPHSLTASL